VRYKGGAWLTREREPGRPHAERRASFIGPSTERGSRQRSGPCTRQADAHHRIKQTPHWDVSPDLVSTACALLSFACAKLAGRSAAKGSEGQGLKARALCSPVGEKPLDPSPGGRGQGEQHPLTSTAKGHRRPWIAPLTPLLASARHNIGERSQLVEHKMWGLADPPAPMVHGAAG
jgi:hypothetical protein